LDIVLAFKGTKGHHKSEMKTIKLLPKNTPKGWCLNIPAAISSTGKRQRQFYASRDKAEAAAKPLREKLRHGDAAVTVMPKVEGEAARKAIAALEKHNLSALKIMDAVDKLIEEHNVAAKSVTFSAACQSYVSERSKKTASHLADFGRLCRRFPDLAAKLLCEIDRATIKRTLAPLPASSRNLALREIRAIFNHGIMEEWCISNPAALIDFAEVDKPKVPTLNAKQVRRLFVAAIRLHPDLVPLLAVQIFAGVRPVESSKLQWDDFDLEDNDKVLTVRAEIAKTGNARHITMHPQLVAWIEWHRGQGGQTEGPLVPARYNTPRKLKTARKPKLGRVSTIPEPLRDALQEIRQRACIVPWPQDGPRHTFASASLGAEWRDIPGVCADLGHNDMKMLRKHYERAMRRRPAERIFAVAPPQRIKGAGKVVAFRAA
jgi:integrase